MNVSSFNLICTGKNKPIILVNDKQANIALSSNNINLWNNLLNILSTPQITPDLGSAIHTAYDLKRLKPNEKENYLFILTDGLYKENEIKRIKYFIDQCIDLRMKIYGIGIGIYPYNAKNIFDNFIYAQNPDNLIKGISKFFGQNIKSKNNFDQPNENKLNIFNINIKTDDLIKKLDINEKYPSEFLFNKLRKKLNNIPLIDEINKDFCNEE